MPTNRAHVRITGRSKAASEVTFQAYDELASRLISAMEATALAMGPDPIDRRRFTLTLRGTDMVALINASLGDDAGNLRISVQETEGWPFRSVGEPSPAGGRLRGRAHGRPRRDLRHRGHVVGGGAGGPR